MVAQFFRLMRWHSPTGAILLYAPCAWGLALAGAEPSWYILFAIGAWFMRSFGCILNDIADRKLDALIPRTQNRPLACGALTLYHAGVCAALCLGVGVCVYLRLPPLAQKWSLLALALACFYPLSKRFFFAPQLILGITFNIGAFIAYMAIAGQWDASVLYVWASAMFWTIAYDTVYAFHDAPYDKAHGFYSTAHMAQQYPRLFVGGSLLVHVLLLGHVVAVQGLIIYAASFVGVLFRWKPCEPSSAGEFFRLNIVLAFILWALIMMQSL